MPRRKITINNEALKKSVGPVSEIEVDEDGIPTDSFWRRRLKDSELDECCELVGAEEIIIPPIEEDEEGE